MGLRISLSFAFGGRSLVLAYVAAGCRLFASLAKSAGSDAAFGQVPCRQDGHCTRSPKNWSHGQSNSASRCAMAGAAASHAVELVASSFSGCPNLRGFREGWEAFDAASRPEPLYGNGHCTRKRKNWSQGQ